MGNSGSIGLVLKGESFQNRDNHVKGTATSHFSRTSLDILEARGPCYWKSFSTDADMSKELTALCNLLVEEVYGHLPAVGLPKMP